MCLKHQYLILKKKIYHNSLPLLNQQQNFNKQKDKKH